MSLVNKRIGAYRLTQKLNESESYEVYQAIHTRTSEEGIIQLAKLTGKLNKLESRARLSQRVETIRALNHACIDPILKYGIDEIAKTNYFYIVTTCYKDGSLEVWLQMRDKISPLSQEDADSIMRQVSEAVEEFHNLGIAGLNIKLSSFMIESTDNPNRPRVFLNDFLPAVLSAERFRKDGSRRKDGIIEDQGALRKLEKLINVNVVEETPFFRGAVGNLEGPPLRDQAGATEISRPWATQASPPINTPPPPLQDAISLGTTRDYESPPFSSPTSSPLQEGFAPEEVTAATLLGMRRRLAIAEEEKQQIQRKLREQEEEKEQLIQELREQKEEHRKRLAIVEEEKEQLIRVMREQKESDAKLLAEAILVATGTQRGGAGGAGAPAIAPPGSGTSRWTGRWLWAPGALLLLALLLAGTIFLLAGLLFFGKPVWAFGSSSAKVTITQAAYKLTDNYIFTGVTRAISQTKTQSITVPATNVVLIPGRHATGILTFHNTQSPCNLATAIPSGTLFKDSHGISVITDKVATVGTSCNAAVPAHAAIIGPTGNIGAHDMRQTYRSIIIVDNPAAFKGGQSSLRFTTVQQSDIANAASSLTVRLKQGALDALRLQLLPSEQLVSSPICKSKGASDHQINDAVTNLNVTVTETCSAEFYDTQELFSRSESMLNNRAQVLFGPNYALTGDITSEVTHVATDVKQGTLITVAASGLWTYQFSSARVDQLARLITGKDKQDAQSILSDQKGVQSVRISISNDDTTMPGDASSITIDYVSALVPIEEG